ncbi:MAG: phosphotransferase [Gemmataceae bacterium]
MPPDPRRFLTAHPTVVRNCRWVPVESAGFSGAGVWCGYDRTSPAFALKVTPGSSLAERTRTIHRWMSAARSAGLGFVPAVVPTTSGDTVAVSPEGVAEVVGWMPGTADFHASPTAVKLTAACAALADLHRVWHAVERHITPCPAVQRRLNLLAEWERLRPAFDRFDAEARILLLSSAAVVNARLPECRRSLAAWSATPVVVFPCLCDVWHDHVLFAGDRVSGVIDYSAMKVDSPAVDLARLLADLVDLRSGQLADGMAVYQDASPPAPVPDELVRVLADTGVVCGIANWVLRLTGGSSIPPRTRIRLQKLLHSAEPG